MECISYEPIKRESITLTSKRYMYETVYNTTSANTFLNCIVLIWLLVKNKLNNQNRK